MTLIMILNVCLLYNMEYKLMVVILKKFNLEVVLRLQMLHIFRIFLASYIIMSRRISDFYIIY